LYNSFLGTIEDLTKERVEQLEQRLDDAEQYSRRNCVEIHGVPVSGGDVLTTVKNVGMSMIDACHTLGTKPSTSGPPGIIVKFVRRMDAEKLLSKRRDKEGRLLHPTPRTS
jgi:hypothetical protein